MGENTSIGWTETIHPDGKVTPGATWNPIRARVKKDAVKIAESKGYSSLVQILTSTKTTGAPRVIPGETWGYHCEIASKGCGRCYACTLNGRTLPGWGTGLPYDRRSRDLVDIYLDEDVLIQPLRWQLARKIFPCSMTDLFADFVPDEFIDKMVAVMAMAGQHTFQCLTKRSARMRDYLSAITRWSEREYEIELQMYELGGDNYASSLDTWPLPNVWPGVSVEDEPSARKRIPELLATPAAVRWTSYEPALGPVDFDPYLYGSTDPEVRDPLNGAVLNWAVVGLESGGGARPGDIQNVRSTIKQFAEAGVPLYVKQLGAKPFDSRSVDILGPEGKVHYRRPVGDELINQVTPANGYSVRPSVLTLKDRKGEDWSEWAEDLRVRQSPEVSHLTRF